jgi:hypothetical protein
MFKKVVAALFKEKSVETINSEAVVTADPAIVENSSTGDATQQRLIERFEVAFKALEDASDFAKVNYQTNVFEIASLLIKNDAGLNYLYGQSVKFDSAGIFYKGPWENAEKLLPELVRGGLDSNGLYPVIEAMSELRLLSIAKGKVSHPRCSASHATTFLERVVALNFEFIFPSDTEEARETPAPNLELCQRLFQLLINELSLESILDDVLAEIEQVCAQRPIMNQRLTKMICLAENIPNQYTGNKRIDTYINAVQGLSPLGKEFKSQAEYREALHDATTETLEAEAEFFSQALNETGLSSPNHAILIRYLDRNHQDIIPLALGLNASGTAEYEENKAFVSKLIRFSVLPSTFRCIYGLTKVLERSLLSRNEIKNGIERLVSLDLCTEVRHNLLLQRPSQDGITANTILVAGVIMVLGQPLGIGQGKNPTCQAARAISLWGQHAPGYLIKLIISAASEGFLEIPFEGIPIRSSLLEGGLSPKMDLDLDPVSIVLVSHLDRLYDEMMTRAISRHEDGHKWVNPALYGHWVPDGFSSIFDKLGQVTNYQDFIRRFYATHNPAYNCGHGLMYPNPVGLLITNTHGGLLGPHAVSIQRVDRDAEGDLRVYFYNPNNEGRQDWGQDIRPTVMSHDEYEGESSLPFEQFASRLYAFHYNPYEIGDGFAVPDNIIKGIENLAQESWGKSYTWL